MQTAEQKKREQVLDYDWIEDVVFVLNNIENCKELEVIWDKRWLHCPCCGAEVNSDGSITHRMQ